MSGDPDPTLVPTALPRVRTRGSPDVPQAPRGSRIYVMTETQKPTSARPGRPRAGPREPPQLPAPHPKHHRPQDRGRRRWARAPPQRGPDDPAGVLRGAVLLRRRRLLAVRRRVAARARGRPGRGQDLDEPQHPQRIPHRRRDRRRLHPARQQLERLRLPVAGVPGRHRRAGLPDGARRPAGPPPPATHLAPADVPACLRAAHRRAGHRDDVRTRRWRATSRRPTRRGWHPRSRRRRTSRRLASAAPGCSVRPSRWSRSRSAPSVCTTPRAVTSRTPPTPHSRSPWSARCSWSARSSADPAD